MKYVVLISFLILISSCSVSQDIQGNVITDTTKNTINNSTNETAFVLEVTDGDTFKLSNNQKVRLIGVNTPEKGEKYYKESTDYLKSLILNKEVILEKDISETDRFSRLLRYVYLTNRTFVNLEMVKNGHAMAKSFKPDVKYDNILREASNPINECISVGCDENTKVVGNKKSLVYHFCYCTYASRISKENLVCFNSIEEAQNLGYKETKIC